MSASESTCPCLNCFQLLLWPSSQGMDGQEALTLQSRGGIINNTTIFNKSICSCCNHLFHVKNGSHISLLMAILTIKQLSSIDWANMSRGIKLTSDKQLHVSLIFYRSMNYPIQWWVETTWKSFTLQIQYYNIILLSLFQSVLSLPGSSMHNTSCLELESPVLSNLLGALQFCASPLFTVTAT